MDVFVCARWENTIGALWGYCRERIGLDSRFDCERTRGGRDWRVSGFQAAGELHFFSIFSSLHCRNLKLKNVFSANPNKTEWPCYLTRPCQSLPKTLGSGSSLRRFVLLILTRISGTLQVIWSEKNKLQFK